MIRSNEPTALGASTTQEPEAGALSRDAARRRYRRPVVEKRRSVSQATMVGSGGVGGALAGGAP